MAGIKGVTVRFTDPMPTAGCAPKPGFIAWCASRHSTPGNRRHTSFASVFVYPEVDDDIDIAINPADLRVDTYRASGAGGQHVNRTDSAIRITHLPTGIVVQCQSDRSQHRTAPRPWPCSSHGCTSVRCRRAIGERDKLESTKADIEWGHQIRSYVLDQSRIKDLRTGVETGNTAAVLDGDSTS